MSLVVGVPLLLIALFVVVVALRALILVLQELLSNRPRTRDEYTTSSE